MQSERMRKPGAIAALIVVLAWCGAGSSAFADDGPANGPQGLEMDTSMTLAQASDEPKPGEKLPEVESPDKPFSVGVSYYLLSDYIFRGINFSEHPAEGREKPNHQLTTSLDIPLGDDAQFGAFGFDTFFEWYADQKKITGDGANIQEIDYTLRWSYDVEPLASTFTIGWTDFIFPNVQGVSDNDRTNEVFVSVDHNDAWMWRWLGYQGDGGILNPSLFVAYDTHIARGVWIELGVSHGFTVVEDLTFTPSIVFAIDGGYLGPLLGTDDHDTRYAFTQFGLDLTYDMTRLLHLPEWAGAVSIGGQLYWTVPTSNTRQTGLDNEFWGGMAVSWQW